jgi:hypothetical protein
LASVLFKAKYANTRGLHNINHSNKFNITFLAFKQRYLLLYIENIFLENLLYFLLELFTDIFNKVAQSATDLKTIFYQEAKEVASSHSLLLNKNFIPITEKKKVKTYKIFSSSIIIIN